VFLCVCDGPKLKKYLYYQTTRISFVLWSSYIVYKGRGLGKRYGIKCGAIGEEIEERMRTWEYNGECHWKSLGTWWELGNTMGNVIGNHWEHGGNIKIVGKKSQTTRFKTLSPSKRKIIGSFACYLRLLIGQMKFLFWNYWSFYSFGLIRGMLYLHLTPIEFHRVKSHTRSWVGWVPIH